jgi:hypothetical protein
MSQTGADVSISLLSYVFPGILRLADYERDGVNFPFPRAMIEAGVYEVRGTEIALRPKAARNDGVG